MSGVPYSDNPYSANDGSDTESFSDELSPTDGYFSRRDMPTELVQDPSQTGYPPEDKVLIARTEARRNSVLGARATDSPTLSQLYPSHTDASATATNYYTPSSSASNGSLSPVSPRQPDPLYSEHTPLMSVPPPAYSASPTSPSPIVASEARNYSTFTPIQLEQGPPPRHEPESMGGPIDEPTERTPLSGPPSERTPSFWAKRSSPRRVLIRKLLFLALVVAVLVGLMTTILNWTPKTSHTDTPSHDYPPSGPYCTSATIQMQEEIFSYDFGTNSDLSIMQTTHEGDSSASASHVTTSGEIQLRLLQKDSQRGPHFSIDVRVSDPELEVVKVWDSDSRTLEVSTPRHARLEHSGPHCISIEVTAWLPHDGKLANLNIASVTLSTRVLEDVHINVSNHATLGSVSGNVLFPKTKEVPTFSFNSRKINIETVSGLITGLYPLYDHLGLYSQSGTIEVGVFPQAIDPDAPAPADLQVKTSSSNIDVRLPIIKLDDPEARPPARDYTTRIESVSGTISGSYYLGSSTKFSSTSGAIGGTFLPIIQSSGKNTHRRAPQNSFDTWTASGTSEIEIAEPLFVSLLSEKMPEMPKVPYQPIGDDDPYLLFPPTEDELFQEDSSSHSLKETLKSLQSSHASTSGKIVVRYPPSWEGTVLAKAVTGNISVDGKGVSKIHEKTGWGSKEILAKKGVDRRGDGSTTDIGNISGGLHFTVYDL